MKSTELSYASVITNGPPSEDTMKWHIDKGYIHLSTIPADQIHPYAMPTDKISFFVKPIDKAEYDKEMAEFKDSDVSKNCVGEEPKPMTSVIRLTDPAVDYNTILYLVKSNLDNHKLMLVDRDVRQVGKTKALIEVCREEGIPILVKDEETRNFMLAVSGIEDLPIFYRTDSLFTYLAKTANITTNKGFMVDEGTSLDKISKLIGQGVCLRTGFYANYYDIF